MHQRDEYCPDLTEYQSLFWQDHLLFRPLGNANTIRDYASHRVNHHPTWMSNGGRAMSTTTKTPIVGRMRQGQGTETGAPALGPGPTNLHQPLELSARS